MMTTDFTQLISKVSIKLKTLGTFLLLKNELTTVHNDKNIWLQSVTISKIVTVVTRYTIQITVK